MANLLTIAADAKQIREMLFKLFQSTRLNILLGSGASMPAITVAGDLEAEYQALYDADQYDEATEMLYNFLVDMNQSTRHLLDATGDANTEVVQSGYKGLFKNLEKILNERRTNILAKQVNIFTTNYDLFIEDSLEQFDSVHLNDGFIRKPSLTGKFTYSTNSFFNTIYNNGNLYNYEVEIPTVNLYKMHGSMTWRHDHGKVIYEVSNRDPCPTGSEVQILQSYIDEHSLVLPRKDKFSETVLQQIYYDLLRLYANELDKENTTLIVFGFSFADEHIIEITRRALKNPTLKIVIFSYSDASRDAYSSQFEANHNVDIISTGTDDVLDFTKLNEIFSGVLPEEKEDE